MTDEQQVVWNNAVREAASLTDGLGRPIDEGILETVAILRLMNINTIGSCAGHKDRVTNGPYIMFMSAKARDLEAKFRAIADYRDPEFQVLRSKAVRLNLRERQKLLPYLEDFYFGRSVPYGQRLIIQQVGPSGSYLSCQGAELAHIVSTRERHELVARNQAEMNAFTEFLKSRFFDYGSTPQQGTSDLRV